MPATPPGQPHVPPAAIAAKPAPSPKPAAHKARVAVSAISHFPAVLYRRTHAVTTKPIQRGGAGSIVTLLAITILAAMFLHHTPPARAPGAAPRQISTPTPHHAPTQPKPLPASSGSAPYNGNFGAAGPVNASIPLASFSNPRFQAAPQLDNSDTVRQLQVDLKAFGIFEDNAITGIMDPATRKTLRALATLTGSSTRDLKSATATLKSAQAHAEDMLWMLGIFPFGPSLPSWLLASLNPADAQTLTDAFNRHADRGPPIFSVPLKAQGLIVRARLLPDAAAHQQNPRCYGFSALFERPPFHHHVISRACRDPDAVHWAMTARN